MAVVVVHAVVGLFTTTHNKQQRVIGNSDSSSWSRSVMAVVVVDAPKDKPLHGRSDYCAQAAAHNRLQQQQ